MKTLLMVAVLSLVGCVSSRESTQPDACELPQSATLTSLDAPEQAPYVGALLAYTSKCASPEQIVVECAGNVMTISQRGYVETWTRASTTEIDLDVVDPSGASTTQRLSISQ